jgi:hypothetical protein
MMPSISRFYGITIRMFFNEDFHPGRPHFHAEYSGVKASFAIEGSMHEPLKPVDPLR